MTKPKHIDILTKGMDIWNEWREKHSHEEVDLSDMDLRETNLAGGYFWKTNFYRTNLNGVNLYKADLVKANLTESFLRGADLRETDLSYANCLRTDFFEATLSKSNLHYSDLRSASLVNSTLTEVNFSFANLTGADLQGADVKKALFAYTIFGDTNLRKVKNLSICEHRFPSIIDPLTLIKSAPLSKSFLQGCGLSEKFVQQIPSLFGRPSARNFFSCFISYSHADKKFAQFLYKSLKKEGVPCWLDEELLPGVDIRDKIDEVINLSDKVLLCCSRNSLGNNSRWVDREMNRALAKEDRLSGIQHKNVQVLIPLALDRYIFSDEWNNGKRQDILDRYIADFSGWKKKKPITSEYKKLIKALRIN